MNFELVRIYPRLSEEEVAHDTLEEELRTEFTEKSVK